MKLLALIAFTAAATFACAVNIPLTQEELVRRTQELYDAVAFANQAPWKKYFADDCIFADEKGRVFDKSKLVADITPLPAGYSGTIKIENAQSRIIGNTAILSYDADETETIFGQKLKARDHVTDTWLQRNDNWQIIASQAHRYYEDPAIGITDPKKFMTISARMNSRPGKPDPSLPKATGCLLSATVKKSSCSRKRQRFSSAKVSKAEFSFVMLPRAKSIR